MAGLCSALLLARCGFQVTLVERDPFQGGSIEAATTWHRAGVPHFLQPHAFIPEAGLSCVSACRTDVYAALLRAGSHEVDLRRKLPGPVHPDDEAPRLPASASASRRRGYWR
jgi:glycine/D-amino acid oxidase-like deaminating enzyme